MTVPDQTAQWVSLALIRRPQGRKGEVFADILTDFPEKFAERRSLWLLADPDSPHPKSPLPQVKGTGFSPYVQSAKEKGALAPEDLPIRLSAPGRAHRPLAP